jgi:hypothetical protein
MAGLWDNLEDVEKVTIFSVALIWRRGREKDLEILSIAISGSCGAATSRKAQVIAGIVSGDCPGPAVVHGRETPQGFFGFSGNLARWSTHGHISPRVLLHTGQFGSKARLQELDCRDGPLSVVA